MTQVEPGGVAGNPLAIDIIDLMGVIDVMGVLRAMHAVSPVAPMMRTPSMASMTL